MRDFVAQGTEALAAAGVPSPVREARRLLSLAAGSPAAVLGPAERVPLCVGRRYRLLLAERMRRVPFSLIAGETGFLDFDLAVGPGVFIPRPETEELAERAIAVLRSLPPRSLVLDLGTGSGALALALARARSDVSVIAVERSPRALACARRNVRRLGLVGRVEVRRSDWFSHVWERFHLIVANPPYVARPELASLDPEVRRYEPRRALDGGPDGLAAIRSIVASAPEHLVAGGTILIEIGDGQGERVLRFARRVTSLVETRVERDLRGRERFFSGRCG
ncbi:MAG TPA: peptide chain release factor N(5)-glutamine methyltransferase [Candidatus Acetothermia bacterium]|nr:peptide chain release factor N(5)-glutamine methyltransferase [Candidatus Acetothermia bacterium]